MTLASRPTKDEIDAVAIDSAPDQVDGPDQSELALLHPLVLNSATAQALFRVWHGARTTVVDSPPGAGKSRLVSTVAAHLAVRSGLRVVVATFTRRQAADIAENIAQQMDPAKVSLSLSGKLDEIKIGTRGFVDTKSGIRRPPAPGWVIVKTIAGCVIKPPEADVMIIDEAYQVTYAAAATGADRCAQILLVGDPGQIGPVVTVDTSEWERMSSGPHKRCPEVFSKRPDALVLNLDQTYRFGQITVDAIAPLYGFGFTSARPPRSIAGLDELESFCSPHAGDPYSLALLGDVAGRAHAIVGRTLRVHGEPDRPIEPADIVVVAARNIQVSSLRALLNGLGMDETAVSTADKVQGGQWEAVVSLDPLAGATDGGASAHGLSTGRLCVMASRHRAHLTWVHDGKLREVLEATAIDATTARLHRQVRRGLIS